MKTRSSTISVDYCLDRSGKFVSDIQGRTDLRIDGAPIFKLSSDNVDIKTRGQGNENLIYWLEWLVGRLPQHLCIVDAPKGEYSSGIDVYKKYKQEFILPKNMPLEEQETEEGFGFLPKLPGKAGVYSNPNIQKFEKWMDVHLLSRAVPGAPQELCIQRWPKTRDYIEISWDWEKDIYAKQSGQIFIPVRDYAKAVLPSSRKLIEQLKKTDFKNKAILENLEVMISDFSEEI